ncbi:uncharacterized protein LOC118747487 isoform X1 [Rhagoletis pomonella]|uniref:uncharacterized protein LOC118747487 isoform X1 n=1 Tax=Rhagoletis pomonella TaxID=28610 RepID=UPI00178777E3|nr:uncharacterized protein LOC118747487 isoform X1 [Rhagoletis pomonella]
MVLRSGIIIPFQFRDNKKLLMIGVPEENRNLNIWDLRNVVRAAFGIYNFEFRNKKIGFNIPDELLLHYLAQRHDLTNFVIEIGQANLCEVSQNNGMMHSPSAESFMASDDTIRLHENDHILNVNRQECGDLFDNKQLKYPKVIKVCDAQSILSNDYETLKKDRAYQEYSEQVSRSELQSITDERTDPKTDQSACEFERQYEMKVDDNQDEQSHNPQIFCPRPPFKFRDGTDP